MCDTLWPEQNDQLFEDKTFKYMLIERSLSFTVEIAECFVLMGFINIGSLVSVMACYAEQVGKKSIT